MPTKPAEAFRYFITLFIFYTSPGGIYLLFRKFTDEDAHPYESKSSNSTILDLLVSLFRVAESDESEVPLSTQTSSSSSSIMLASAAGFLWLLLLIIPAYLQSGPIKRFPGFLLLAIPELHFFAWRFIATLYELSNWISIPIGIITYELTHSFMLHQFLALGMTPSELGYFATMSTMMMISPKSLDSQPRPTVWRSQTVSRQRDRNAYAKLDGKS